MTISRSLSVFTVLALVCGGHAYASQFGPHPYGPFNDGRYAYGARAYPAYRPNRYAPMPVPRYNARAYYPGHPYAAPPGRESAPAPVAAVPGLKKRPQPAAEAGVDTREPAILQPASAQGNKPAFIATLLPHIEKENRRLLALRKEVGSLLDKLDAGNSAGKPERARIKELAQRYRVKQDPLTSKAAREELLRKIDIIPSSMALAQAVNESAWGQSRFAQEANNLFGIWTYDVDKGLVPRNREQGKKHLVRIFDDYGESVRYYIHTLNSHPAYAGLRGIRETLRTSGQTIDGHKLAAGLEKYSAKGQQYIDIIQGLIRQNRWAQLDTGNHAA